MQQANWINRKFEFSGSANIMPAIIERLDGTAVRLREKMKKIDPAYYTLKPDGKWSMLEHIGHLADVEPLGQERLEELLEGKSILKPADMTNRATEEANHNSKSVSELIEEFERLRAITVEKLRALKDEDVFRSAIHPRLQTPMRTLDLFTFVAEHDDHHLAKITEIATIVRDKLNIEHSNFEHRMLKWVLCKA